MFKIDHRKTLKHLYHPSRITPTLIDVPPMNFLMMDGRGKPSGSGFQQAASTLYPLAYTLKFMVRAASDVDYHVMPMEVRWRVNREKQGYLVPARNAHDIYLNDVRKTKPENLQAIMRLPVIRRDRANWNERIG